MQRTVKREETQSRILQVASSLEASGFPKNKIASELAKILPFDHLYVLKLLPDEYKQKKFAVSPGRPRKLRDTIVFPGKRLGATESSAGVIDKETKCDGMCGKLLARGDLKECLLCKDDSQERGSKLVIGGFLTGSLGGTLLR